MEFYFCPSSALHPQKCTEPLHWVNRPTLVTYFLVPPYLPTSKLVQISQDPFVYPHQMRNGGSPPAHLSSSTDAPINPSGWLKLKWYQPPWTPPTGWSTNGMLAPITMTIGWIAHGAKTTGMWGYCHRCHWGGKFLPRVALLRNKPTGTGRGPCTNFGRASAIASRWQPANTFLMTKPLINYRRLHIANTILSNTPPWHKGWRQHAPSSCGSAATTSTPGSPD